MTFDTKPGVILPPMLQLLAVAAQVYGEVGAACVVTAGLDGKHMAGSLHYRGLALDLRTRHLRDGEAELVARQMRERLGQDFDVVVEGDHIHAEHDPKGV